MSAERKTVQEEIKKGGVKIKVIPLRDTGYKVDAWPAREDMEGEIKYFSMIFSFPKRKRINIKDQMTTGQEPIRF